MQQETEHNTRRPRSTAPILIILFLVLALLFLVSCANGPEQAPAAPSSSASPTAVVVQENALPNPTNALAVPDQPPTSTPLPAASPDPATLEEVKGAYRLVVVTQLLADSLNEAALDAQSGAQDALATNARLVLAGVISTGITGATADLSPPEPMATYMAEAQNINLALDELATAWQAGEQTPAGAITAIEPHTIALAQVAQNAEAAMFDQWQIEPASISQLRQDIIAEVTQILSDLASDLQSPAPTTPPTT